MMKLVAVGVAGVLLSTPVLAQAGGPDLPGSAKTTRGASKSMGMQKRSGSKMKMMVRSKGKMPGHKTF